jgi:multidrug efflux pump subunit AcrB
MWLVVRAMRRPYTVIVLALTILLSSALAIQRAPADIFPDLGVPVVYVVQPYGGMSPSQMEGQLVGYYEYHFLFVAGIEHIESQSIQGMAMLKLYFHPGTDIAQSTAQVTAMAFRATAFMPPGTLPPFIVRFDAGSIPVGQLVFSSDTRSDAEIQDQALFKVRPMLATLPGVSAPPPSGGKIRTIEVFVDPQKLRAYHLSPDEVAQQLAKNNLTLPQGNVRVGDKTVIAATNAMVKSIKELADIPLRTGNGPTVFVRDIGRVEDAADVVYNIALVDGRRTVYMPLTKRADASTLDVVANIKAALPAMRAQVPADIHLDLVFDQSVYVSRSIHGLVFEGALGAILTSLAVILFLRNLRAALIVIVTIPLSVLAAIVGLRLAGQTINIMTLGGLALAVGILVDDATVTIENIERQMAMKKALNQAILDGAEQIAVPALVSTLAISIVFVPMFFLTGVARYLFVPLAEAVVFALLASYFFSRTLVPTLVMYLMKEEAARHANPGDEQREGIFSRVHHGFERGFEALRSSYSGLLQLCLDHRKLFASGLLGFCLLSMLLVTRLGQDFFPTVDAGQFRLHLRAKTGTRIEETARVTSRAEDVIRRVIPASELGGILDNIGLPTSGINLSYSNSETVGNHDAEILVSLNANHHPTAGYIEKLRATLPKQFPATGFFFEPADIVTQTLNFGLPAPIDIQLVGADMPGNFALAARMTQEIRAVPGAVDVHVHQLLNQPRLDLAVDRVRTQQVGLSERDVATNVLTSLSSSFQTAPNFWLSPNGVSYPIAIQTPQYKVDSIDTLRTIPINSLASPAPQLLENLTAMNRTQEPAVVSHYNVQRTIDIYASTQSRDLGGVASDIAKITAAAQKQLPNGSSMVTRGQVATMRSSFVGLGAGLAFAIVLVYLLIVVNFQSWSEAFIIIAALPAALAGIVWMLYLTHTTLSVPALMGTIMSMGVATANSVLVISFANERFAETKDALRAALEAGSTRLRPVIMTALAMIIGMVPMAIGLGEGGEQNAPLGRAVIGGLLFATVATLFFVPAVFAIVRNQENQNA